MVWLEYSTPDFLIGGDATDTALNLLCVSYILTPYSLVNLYDCNVIKMPNHGNANSACARLYDLTHPEYAVVSVGENGLGCPSVEAISNAVNYVGENLYRTDKSGTVTFEVTHDGYSIV